MLLSPSCFNERLSGADATVVEASFYIGMTHMHAYTSNSAVKIRAFFHTCNVNVIRN